MQLKATCVSSVPTGDGLWVLLKFDPPDDRIGESANVALEQGGVYRVTIEKVSDNGDAVR
jgi:hypothetical protein